MKRLATCALLCGATVWAGELAPFWTLPVTADELEKQSREAFDRARAERDRLLAVEGPRTVQNTLVPFDEANRLIVSALTTANSLRDTHPDESFRKAAQKTVQEALGLQLEIRLDPRIYQALAPLERTEALDAETSYYLRTVLKTFRNAGVDKPEEVRRRIRAARAEIVKLQQQFDRNIIDGLATVSFPPEALDGVPADFVRSHTHDGRVRVSNDRADFDAVVSYAKSQETRRKTAFLFWNRGYPANMDVLSKLIVLRHKVAALCGFSTFAEMEAQMRMIGSEAKQRAFLDDVDSASREGAAAEAATILEAKRRDQPGTLALDSWDLNYYVRRVRDERYGYDERRVRDYFPYSRVKESVFEISSILFGVTFQPVRVPVWHPTVETYNVLENGTVIGRIYLDMFPRKDKFQHFASGVVRIGLANRQLPEGVLICNMPAPGPNEPALLTPDLARTFFHEFGHLLHTTFSGRQRWAGLARNAERDFAEAPSQMLEEWWRNPKVLKRFTRHYKTGETIGAALIDRMEGANGFGKALSTRRQIYLSSLSLELHSRGSEVDSDSVLQETYSKYAILRFPDGAHNQCSFSHLGEPNYASTYYTYLWSLVIARDLLTGFNPDDLLDPGPARKYRRTVLEPGGSMPAAQLVENFLGRPFNFKAYQEWLQAK